ncbi:hypothetical protein ABT317_45850, partial [Streptomyces carpinensis]
EGDRAAIRWHSSGTHVNSFLGVPPTKRRGDLTYRPVVDAPQSGIALAWPEEATTDLVDDFIGIVRGRTVNSTRGRSRAQTPDRTEGASTGRKPAAGRTTARDTKATSTGGGSGGSRGAKGSKSSQGSHGAKGSRTAKGAKAGKRGRPRRP